MVDFTSSLTFINTHHANINLGLDIFMIILLIVLIAGGNVVGIGAGFTVAGLVTIQVAQIALNAALKYQDKLVSRFGSQASVSSLDPSEF
jgi:hypothetical protein